VAERTNVNFPYDENRCLLQQDGFLDNGTVSLVKERTRKIGQLNTKKMELGTVIFKVALYKNRQDTLSGILFPFERPNFTTKNGKSISRIFMNHLTDIEIIPYPLAYIAFKLQKMKQDGPSDFILSYGTS